MKHDSGEVILAVLVALTVCGLGMASLTGRHNAIVAKQGGVGVDVLALSGKREAVKQNPGTTAAIVAAGLAAGLAADQIHIGDNYTTIINNGGRK